jgi:GT2 family glycosyltransferase
MTEMMTVPVSVAIPAYGNADSLRETLRRVCGCVPLPQEILVHADGGWQVPPEVYQGLPVSVRVITSTENLGPGGGRHRLFHEAACEIIASFDDDSWPLDREYFAQAMRVMEAFPGVAVMSPAVYLREKPVLGPMWEASTGRSFEGSASVHRRSHYLQLPGYVPVPAAYGVEEADLSLQIHAAGFEILSCPWMRAWHDRPYADHEHTVLPWIRNEVLLAYLRFPYIAQPWGWVRALRHVLRHRKEIPYRVLLRELAQSLPNAISYHPHKRRYSMLEVWRHHRCQEQRFQLAEENCSAGDRKLQVTPGSRGRRVLYIQYTNPGSYPPLEHSARMFAREGWEVEFCGLTGSGPVSLDFAPHPRVHVRRIKYRGPGLTQKLHYVFFTFWCLVRVLRWRPQWIYASDALSTPAAELIRRLTRCRVIYHEHDSPTPGMMKESRILRHVLRTRLQLGRGADIVILPNQQRLDTFTQATDTCGQSFCVWNCPGEDEVPAVMPSRSMGGPLKVLYHGSIVPDRFGTYVLEAIAASGRDVQVRLMGYLPAGHLDYAKKLAARAQELGVADRFEYLGAIPQRADLMRLGSECHVGLCMLRIHEGDINMQHMAGASNKPFDYLSQGIALIVPPDPEWERMYVETGCAKTCPINDAARLADVFRWMADHREEVAEMGLRGHRLVRDEWNYEKQFAPVLALIQQQPDSTSSS